MYDTSFACTYHLADDDLAEDLYRVQVLQAFGDVGNIGDAEPEIDLLYAEMGNAAAIVAAIQALKQCGSMGTLIELAGGDECAFRLLFGFDTFHAMHRCVCDQMRNGTISPASADTLVKACRLAQG